MRNSEFILYPSISVCSMTSRAFIRDGKIDKSHSNNVEKSQTFTFGYAPDLTKIVQFIKFMDTSGTFNVLNSSNSFQGDLERKTTFAHYALQGPMETSDGLWVSTECIWLVVCHFLLCYMQNRVLAGSQSRVTRLCHNSTEIERLSATYNFIHQLRKSSFFRWLNVSLMIHRLKILMG